MLTNKVQSLKKINYTLDKCFSKGNYIKQKYPICKM